MMPPSNGNQGSTLQNRPDSLNAASGLLNAILMKNQALSGAAFRQFEFKRGVDPMIGPARGKVRKNLLRGLIRNPNHQVPIAILNIENEGRLQLIATDQSAAKFRIDGDISRLIV